MVFEGFKLLIQGRWTKAMTEMEDGLRSCMEQVVIAREERERIIVEAASEISSQQKKVRDLQHNLEAANKKAAKLTAENNNLCKAIDAKDKLCRELKESRAASDEKLAGATAKLDAAQKQSASLQYEVRMLQKELDVRSQEREYDLKSVDAARAQQAESLKKIAQLEGECQRLRAMVRKRLPGPAALAKMRDEVEQQPWPGASPRRQRSVTPLSPRSMTPSRSPRSVTPRRAPHPPESYNVRLCAIEDENKTLKQMLATRDSELQFVQMKYADEACRLSVVQGQLKELTEEGKRLSDAHGQSQSWASALVCELDHFRAAKQGQGASSSMVSDMSLLDDFAEMERLEMASGDQTSMPSGALRHDTPRASSKEDSRPAMSEKNGNDLVLDGHPEWVQDVWELVTRKHEASGESIDAVLEEIRRALDQSSVHAEGDACGVLYDRTEVEKMLTNLIEKITAMIRVSAEDNAARSGSLLPDKSEFCARLEYLIHICHDVLQGKAKLENVIGEVCLILEYIVSQYFSNKYRSDTVNNNTKNFDGCESLSTVNADGEHDMQSAKSAAALDSQREAHEEPILSAEGQIPDHILVSHQECQMDEELARVTLDQDDHIQHGRKSSYYEIESSPADGGAEDLARREEKQLPTNSEISAAADKLAECQETITNLSKQLQALQSLPNSGTLDISMYSARLGSADYKPQSLANILAEENTNTEIPSSPTPKEVHSKKKHGEPDVASERSMTQEQNADGEESALIVVHPVFPEPRRAEIPADPKKKRGPSLLGRIIFRKKVEGSSS